MEDINVQELKAKIDNNDNFLLIDVREQLEFDMFNLGGQLIPLGILEHQIPNLELDKNAEIVVHCRSGMRSATAKQILVSHGFTKVRNLLGGVLAWQENFSNPS